ncbi:hypothetical protein BsWGS_02606 [Bradybaena similaris]
MALVPSKIFSAYRALGFVSNHIPLVTRYHKRHKDNYIVTCVGQAFHVHEIFLMISPQYRLVVLRSSVTYNF